MINPKSGIVLGPKGEKNLYEIAVGSEKGSKGCSNQSESSQAHSSQAKPSSGRGPRKDSQDTSKGSCFRCGAAHSAGSCRAKNYKCYYCSKVGHTAAACRKRMQEQESSQDGRSSQRSHQQQSVHQAEQISKSQSEELIVNTVSPTNSRDKMLLNLVANGHSVTHEVDTGAVVTLYSKASWEKLGNRGK